MSHATYKCKDCGESFVWRDFGNDGYCKKCDIYTVDATHTDAGEKETALALKYRQRARAAEELNKVMLDALVTCECYHQGGHSELGNMLRKLIGESK
jgi:hypothetical protein